VVGRVLPACADRHVHVGAPRFARLCRSVQPARAFFARICRSVQPAPAGHSLTDQVDTLLADSGAVAADRAAVGAGAGAGEPILRSWAAVDADGDLRAVDGAQASMWVGVRDVDARGVGLHSLAALLSVGIVRAGGGRVDCAQADAPVGAGGGARAPARADSEGKAGEALSSPGGADRLDRGRGRCPLSVRRRACLGRGAGLAREGRKLAAKINAKRTAVRDRLRAVGKRVRGITRTMRRRSGDAKAEVLKLTEQTGELSLVLGIGVTPVAAYATQADCLSQT